MKFLKLYHTYRNKLNKFRLMEKTISIVIQADNTRMKLLINMQFFLCVYTASTRIERI